MAGRGRVLHMQLQLTILFLHLLWGQFKLTVLTWMTQKQTAVPTAWLQGLSTCLPT